MRRGDVVLIADRAAGDYAAKPRPAVVVQADVFAGTGSVLICPLTTMAVDAPLLRVPISPGPELALSAPSWAMAEKLTAVRRDRIGRGIGRVTPEEMLALERCLAVVLGFG
jgi:mRNA interferase MazF